jgi:hypothetical protein
MPKWTNTLIIKQNYSCGYRDFLVRSGSNSRDYSSTALPDIQFGVVDIPNNNTGWVDGSRPVRSHLKLENPGPEWMENLLMPMQIQNKFHCSMLRNRTTKTTHFGSVLKED